MAIKQGTVQRKVAAVEQELDHLERHLYAPRGIGWVCDTIAWLWKFKHIDEATKNRLCDRAIEYMEGGCTR